MFSPDGCFIAIACVGATAYESDAGGDGGGGAQTLTLPQFFIRIYSTVDGREACAPLLGHSGIIHSLDWTPDSCWLLSASSDGTALVWALPRSVDSSLHLGDVPPYPHSRLLHPQLPFVYAAKFHPGGAPSVVITACYDGLLRLWDALLGEPIGQEISREANYLGVIGESSSTLAATTASRYSNAVGSPPPFYLNCCEWEGVGQGLDGGVRLLVTGDSRGCLRFYTPPPDKDCHKPEKYILVKALRPAGLKGAPIVSIRARPYTRLRSASSHLLVLSQASRLLVYDGLSMQPIRTFPGPQCSSHRIEACWSPDGQIVACGSEVGSLALWDAETGLMIPATAAVANVDESGHVVPGKGKAVIGYPSMLPSVTWTGGAASIAVCGFGSEYSVLLLC